MPSTSVKLAGGVSAKDARAFAEEMRCATELIQGAKKRGSVTEFACYIRNTTPHAIRVSVPLGYVEAQPAMTSAEYDQLLAANRTRYCAPRAGVGFEWAEPVRPPEPSAVDQQVETEPRTTQPLPAADAPPKRAALTPATTAPALPSPMGRGGERHVYLQELVKRLAEDLGYRAVIEQPVREGAGQVDVGLERGGFRIACEISVASSREQELANVRKCLAAGFDQVVVIAPDRRQLQRLAKFMSERLEPTEQERVSVLKPEDVEPFLAAVPSEPPPPSERTVRGYRVTVQHKPASAADQQARREAIAKVLARSLRQISN